MSDPKAKYSLAVISLLASSTAFAHPGHNVSGFAAGWMHPFSGLDHLLAMVAVGLWAAQRGGSNVWLLPATFMAALAAGAGLAMHWQALPMVEAGIATSVLALGLLAALSLQLPITLCMSLTGLFGLLHGYAHGLELPQSAAPATYALGFLAATAALHCSGLAIGMAAGRHETAWSRRLGLAIAASGLYLLVSA